MQLCVKVSARSRNEDSPGLNGPQFWPADLDLCRLSHAFDPLQRGAVALLGEQ